MSRRGLLALVAVVAVGVLAWDLLRSPAPPAVAPPAAAGVGPAASAPASSPAASSRGPAEVGRTPNFLRPVSVARSASPLAQVHAESPLALKPLYDRIKGSPEENTPEGQFYLHKILKACATIADRRGGAAARPQRTAQLEERRQQIAAGLPEGNPRREQRLAAFDKVATDQCEGLGGLTVTEAELSQYLKNALAGGDPKARAWQVEQEMWQERRAASTPGRAGTTLTEAQVATLRESFSSRDAEAIAIAGRVLANSFRDVTVRIGPEQEPIENRAFMNAATLLACEYGYPCGENNPRVLSACAFQGHCGVASLPDYLFYYGASPYDAQLLDRYRTVLRQAVDTGDWSALVIDRGTRSPNLPSYPYAGHAGFR
ncbi:MAG: hypothetical protein NDI88_14300 [Lysobacter sp.]|nr:hypothetical protein [Lysobacter sp.]